VSALVCDLEPRLYCPTCGNDVVPVVYRRGPHIRADCGNCGEFIKFVAKGSPWAELAVAEVTPLPHTPLFGVEA
jgi:transcription elongation factor Elf1